MMRDFIAVWLISALIQFAFFEGVSHRLPSVWQQFEDMIRKSAPDIELRTYIMLIAVMPVLNTALVIMEVMLMLILLVLNRRRY